MKKLLLVTALLNLFLLGAEEKDPVIRDGAERKELIYSFDCKNYLVKSGDDSAASAPDFDDKNWEKVEIGKSLTLSGVNNGSVVWYRKEFYLDRPLPELLWFEPGYISAGDTVFLNGEKIASTAHRGATFKCRRYLLKNAPFRQGKNVLAIRVQLGYMKGMYFGTPQIYRAELPPLLMEYLPVNEKIDPLKRQLSENPAVNIFAPGEAIAIQQKLLLTGEDPAECRVVYRLGAEEKSIVLPLLPRVAATAPTVSFSAPEKGEHQMQITLFLNGRKAAEKQLSFRIEARKNIVIPVTGLSDTAKIRIGEYSVGSCGPRQLYKRTTLADRRSSAEIRGAAVGALGISRKGNGALPMFTNVDLPAGKWELQDWDDTIGSRYDGLLTSRVLGIVELPGRQLRKFHVSKVNWISRSWRLDYDGEFLECTINHLAPGWQFRSGAKKLRLFRPLKELELGGPSKLYFPGGSTPDDLAANHFVVSWEKSANWNGIHMPVAVILEKKPRQISLDEDGVLLSFDGEAGKVLLVPLYGVTPRPACELTEKDLARAAELSRLIPGLPVEVKRSIAMDWEKDRLLIKDEFSHLPWQDAWNTPIKPYAPLPPSFVLAAISGMVRISSGKAVIDCNYPLNSGPLCVVEGNTALTAVDGLAALVREQREVLPGGQSDPALSAQLEALVLQELPELEKHPWAIFRTKGRNISVGELEPGFTNLLLSMPFLTDATCQKLLKAIDDEARLTFVNDDLPVHGKRRIKPTPINHHLTSSVTGKILAAPYIHVHQSGIDGPCWVGNQISLLWNYAWYCGKMDFLKQHQESFERYLNTIINSLDWSYSVSWDSHSGIRVGNGLQESTIFYAAFASAAKYYHLTGNLDKRDEMSACAMIQLIGIVSAVSPRTIQWLRENRPWLATHPDAVQIARDERLLPGHFLEFNERGGFFHSLIRGGSEPLFSDAWIMTPTPQVMRPFRDLWGKVTDAHYRPTLPDPRFELPVPVDSYLYMTPHPPVPVEEQFKLRMAFPLRPGSRIADLRAILEYQRGVRWRALW